MDTKANPSTKGNYLPEINGKISLPIINTFEELIAMNKPEVDGAIFSLYVSYVALLPNIPQTLADYLELVVKDYLHNKISGNKDPKNYSEETAKFLKDYQVSDEFHIANKTLENIIYGLTRTQEYQLTEEQIAMNRYTRLMQNNAIYGMSGVASENAKEWDMILEKLTGGGKDDEDLTGEAGSES